MVHMQQVEVGRFRSHATNYGWLYDAQEGHCPQTSTDHEIHIIILEITFSINCQSVW